MVFDLLLMLFGELSAVEQPYRLPAINIFVIKGRNKETDVIKGQTFNKETY